MTYGEFQNLHPSPKFEASRKFLHLPDPFPSQAQVTSSAILYSDTLSLSYSLNAQ